MARPSAVSVWRGSFRSSVFRCLSEDAAAPCSCCPGPALHFRGTDSAAGVAEGSTRPARHSHVRSTGCDVSVSFDVRSRGKRAFALLYKQDKGQQGAALRLPAAFCPPVPPSRKSTGDARQNARAFVNRHTHRLISLLSAPGGSSSLAYSFAATLLPFVQE